MTNYWKKRFYRNNRELRKQRKQMKILLSCTIGLVLIFGALFVVGYTGKQLQNDASKTVDSFSALLIDAINPYYDTIMGIMVVAIVILIILLIIWSWIPKQPPPHSIGY